MSDIKQNLEILERNYQQIKEVIDIAEKENEIKKLQAQATDPKFWSDQDKATLTMQKIADLKKEVEEIIRLGEGLAIMKDLALNNLLDEGYENDLKELQAVYERYKLRSFLSGPFDSKNAIVSINAGQGGTEAMDWTEMLYRMYLRFCERQEWKTYNIDFSAGEEAGLKSVTFKVIGQYAYGYLKGEAGTHRLVRQSPFNADNLRQTSFALVGLLPELTAADLPEISIEEKDLQWEFFHSSSQGGQNVQKVSTAVRVHHKPTGIVASAQTERFQEQNRKIALELLRAKLWALAEEQKKGLIGEIKGEYKPASWGNQIRSYVLHPYKMIKDLRTKIETGNTEAVLDGNLDEFIAAELKLN